MIPLTDNNKYICTIANMLQLQPVNTDTDSELEEQLHSDELPCIMGQILPKTHSGIKRNNQ